MARLFREHGPIDGVLHFAASLSVAESVAKPLLYYRNNVAGSANLIAESLAAGVRAFVLSSIGRSNREVIPGVARVIGRPVPHEEAPRRPGDAPTLVADISHFKREFGWQPRYSDLDTIVRTAWDWLRSWKRIS